MNAIETRLDFVGPCGCPRSVYHSLWDLLSNQLFAQFPPPWIEQEDTLPDVTIWSGAQIEQDSSTAFYVTIEEGTTPPKVSDIIFFEKMFYIIGNVTQSGNRQYYCSQCVLIDLSIVAVYAALNALNAQVSANEAGRTDAESGRVTAEDGRVTAEGGRVSAETQRVADFNASQAERTAAYVAAEGTEQGSSAGDGSRWGAFYSAEAGRLEQMAELLAPWVVPGVVMVDNNHFVADDEGDTPQEAKDRFDSGFNTYLTDRNGRTEAIVADDGDYLITMSGWMWRYTE